MYKWLIDHKAYIPCCLIVPLYKDKEIKMELHRPSLKAVVYEKFLAFVLKKYGTTHRKANEELEKAIGEYLENHASEVDDFYGGWKK